jgi:DNA-binding MarR family transcriptional regulator
MNDNEYKIVLEFRNEISKLVNQYNKLENMPFDTGLGDCLFPSELNMIEAIHTNKGRTVTELCIYFGITKGAVSQTITKLINKGYVSKTRSLSNKKELIIELTQKGIQAFDSHDQFHRRMDEEIARYIKSIPADKMQDFKQMLSLISQHIEKYSNLQDKHI